jgi:hypothetical protein
MNKVETTASETMLMSNRRLRHIYPRQYHSQDLGKHELIITPISEEIDLKRKFIIHAKEKLLEERLIDHKNIPGQQSTFAQFRQELTILMRICRTKKRSEQLAVSKLIVQTSNSLTHIGDNIIS